MLDTLFRSRLVKEALAAVKEAAERAVRAALGAASVPTGEDVEELRRRLGELEATLDALASRREGPAPDPGGESVRDPRRT